MIKVFINLNNCELEKFASSSNVHVEYSKSKVKLGGSECNQNFTEPVRPPRTPERSISVIKVENDEDHTSGK